MMIEDYIPNLRRRMVWDIVPDHKVRGWSKQLGLFPASDEVDEQERAAAYIRLSRLNPLAEAMGLLTGLAGEVLAESMCQHCGHAADEEDVAQITFVLTAGSRAILAELMDLKVLQYGEAVMEV